MAANSVTPEVGVDFSPTPTLPSPEVHISTYRNADDHMLTAEVGSLLDDALGADPSWHCVSEGTARPQTTRVHWIGSGAPAHQVERLEIAAH